MRKISSDFNLAGLRIHIAPFVVWMSAVLLIVALFSYRSRRFQVLGIAQGPEQEISATCVARLESVEVELFDEVKKDQIVAVLDTRLDDEKNPELLKAQMNTISAEIERLRAEWAEIEDRYKVEAANMQNERITEQRRFEVDLMDARLRVLELSALIRTDEIALEKLELDSKIFLVQGRMDANDSAPLEMKQIKIDHAALSARIEENKAMLQQAEEDFSEAQKRHKEFVQRQPQAPSTSAAMAVIDKAIAVQERRMDELKVQQPLLKLVSPFDGVVSLIQRGPGETVLAGEPILTVVAKEPTEVLAYAGEGLADQVKQLMTVQVMKRSGTAQNSQVTYVGPTVEKTPQRLWRNPNVPEWGRPILIKKPPKLSLTPGEVVGIIGI